MRSYNQSVMFLQFGLYMIVGLSTMIIVPHVVSGDSMTQRQSVIMRLSTPPSQVIR